MSQLRQTPIPDRPEPVAPGRRAAIGALVCLIIGTGIVWSLWTRVAQMVQPASIVWDNVPLAIEMPADQVNAIARGKAEPGPILAGAFDIPSGEVRFESRVAEERRLLVEMFQQNAANRSSPTLNSPRQTQTARLPAPDRPTSASQPVPKLEVQVPSVTAENNFARSFDKPSAAGNTMDARPWQAAGSEAAPEPGSSKPPVIPVSSPTRFGSGPGPDEQPKTSPEDSSTSTKTKFPPRFSGHSTILPSASMQAPGTISTAGKQPVIRDARVEQAAVQSSFSVLAETLKDSANRLDRPPPDASERETPNEPASNRDSDPAPVETFVTVEEGDSFWTIAQRVYGDGNYFSALYFENQGQAGQYDDLATGLRLRCPSPESLRKKYPELNLPFIGDGSLITDAGRSSPGFATRVYCTAAGDTLFGVARQQLGQAARYLEIRELNRSILGSQIGHLDPLPEGLKIKLPIPAR